MVARKSELPVKVQQCLFGYEDGHRLLASSLQLTNDVESMLLKLSDLAPGITELSARSYWTGVPIASIKHYALLHTWSAPEMPRPGCVWTHILLIGFSDIARFVDLNILELYSVRPTLNSQYEEYSTPLLIDETKAVSTKNIADNQLDYSKLLKVIRAIYNPSEQPYLFGDAGEFDASVFRVWSQQWPRLRRSFSFMTAGSLSVISTAGIQFDLRVLPQSDNCAPTEKQLIPLEPKPWEAAAIKDALCPEPTEFRRFLWRYGSDIHKGREQFNFLANLYLSSHQNLLGINSYEDMLLQVAKTLPDPEDGKALKSDLVEGSRNTYSLMPAVDPLEHLMFFVQHPLVKGLPLPVDSTLSHLQPLWPTRSEEIIILAEQSLKTNSTLRESILTQLTELMDADSFISTTYDRPNLRHSLVTKRPSLLNSTNLQSINQPELSKLLTLLPDDLQLADQVIGKLIHINDKDIAKEMFTRFPNIVTRRVVDAIEKISLGSNQELPKAWLQIITKSTADFLRGGHIDNLQSINSLAIFAEALGHRNRDVLKVGPRPWASALVKVNDEIREEQRDKLYAFLLLMAIKQPLHGCEPIFELTFDPIHSALANDKLASNARSLISESLPDLHFWNQWDMCHRLRLAVVRAYTDNKLDRESFYRLTNNQEVAETLVELATETKKGRNFLKRKQHVVPFNLKTDHD